ncbi:ATP-binding protein [Methyloraptor flagellatus]|uniref:histidine kinase n=1 Tax=Methyloraptor flagellatus TaxID=3162530 RepID=A0AAU7XB31_9HYPH
MLESSIEIGDDYRLPPALLDAASGGSNVLGLRTLRLRDAADENRAAIDRAFVQRILDDTPDMIVRCLADTTIIFANRAYAEAHGVDPEQLIGCRVADIARPVDPAALEAIFQSFGKDGEEYISTEMDFRRLDGRIATVFWTSRIFYGATGEVEEIQSVGRDVTELRSLLGKVERQNRELERLNQQISATNEGLKQFNRIVCHDLQEPLSKLNGYSEVLRQAVTTGDAEEIEFALGVIQDSAGRAGLLVRDMSRFARMSEQAPTWSTFRLAPFVDGVIRQLGRQIRDAGADVSLTIDQDLIVRGDLLHCRQIFLNLISNAVKYRSPERPARIAVVAKPVGLDGAFAVTVSDNGVGFDKVHARAIFEPFLRLRGGPARDGTGMGLTIAAAAARAQGFELTADGRIGEGSTFCLIIPPSNIDTAAGPGHAGERPELHHDVV